MSLGSGCSGTCAAEGLNQSPFPPGFALQAPHVSRKGLSSLVKGCLGWGHCLLRPLLSSPQSGQKGVRVWLSALGSTSFFPLASMTSCSSGARGGWASPGLFWVPPAAETPDCQSTPSQKEGTSDERLTHPAYCIGLRSGPVGLAGGAGGSPSMEPSRSVAPYLYDISFKNIHSLEVESCVLFGGQN